MKKITVKNLIEFRGKKEKSKLTFINNLKKEKKKSEKGDSGDYWISALSAVRNTFKFNDERLLDEKIEELNEKIKLTEGKISTLYIFNSIVSPTNDGRTFT